MLRAQRWADIDDIVRVVQRFEFRGCRGLRAEPERKNSSILSAGE
jgi:hypothetical protein